MTDTQTNQATFEALLERADSDTIKDMFIYLHILLALEKPGAPAEAQRLNDEMQAEITAGTLTPNKHEAYIAAMLTELDVWGSPRKRRIRPPKTPIRPPAAP